MMSRGHIYMPHSCYDFRRVTLGAEPRETIILRAQQIFASSRSPEMADVRTGREKLVPSHFFGQRARCCVRAHVSF